MSWIYLSPHLDDVVLSCGGLLWEQAQAGESVSIWTICAGDAPLGSLSPFAESLHQRWQTTEHAPAIRRAEDLAAGKVLGANCRHFSVPDCIYRRSRDGNLLYPLDEDIHGPIRDEDLLMINHIANEISQHLPKECRLVSPLAIGNHLDHRVVRAAAEKVGYPLQYYADYPYVIENQASLVDLIQAGWKSENFLISGLGLEAWIRAISAYTTQISTFWPDMDALASDIQAYLRDCDCVRLWLMPLK